MTKVRIEPGICNLTTHVEAVSEDGEVVTIKVKSGCKSVMQMMKAVGDTFDALDFCLQKPGASQLYAYASENFPLHSSCPVIAGIGKCAEVECNLALKKDAGIFFED